MWSRRHARSAVFAYLLLYFQSLKGQYEYRIIFIPFISKNINLSKILIGATLLPFIVVIALAVKRFVTEHTRYWVDGLVYNFNRRLSIPLSGGQTLKQYCKLLLNNDSIKFLNVPSSLDIKLDIDRVFVTLSMEQHGSGHEPYTHTDILTAGNRLSVIGDPGSGKTSLVKRLLRDMCRFALENPSEAKLPIFIELRNLDIPAKIKKVNNLIGFSKKYRTRLINTMSIA